MTEEKCPYKGHWIQTEYENDNCKFQGNKHKQCQLCLMGQLIEVITDI